MFDDLTLEQLRALQVTAREAWQKLSLGLAVAEVRYGDTGRKFHPASVKEAASFLQTVTDEIKTRTGTRRGGFTVVHGG